MSKKTSMITLWIAVVTLSIILFMVRWFEPANDDGKQANDKSFTYGTLITKPIGGRRITWGPWEVISSSFMEYRSKSEDPEGLECMFLLSRWDALSPWERTGGMLVGTFLPDDVTWENAFESCEAHIVQ